MEGSNVMAPDNLHITCGHWHGVTGGTTPRTWTPIIAPPVQPQGSGYGSIDDPSDGITVYFNALLGAAEGRESQYSSRTFSCNIPAGVYRITLKSFDDHIGHPGQYQPDEAFYCKLYNGAGNLVYTTPTIGDIPDNSDNVVSVVDSGAYISERVSTIRIFHKLYDSLPTDNWNSVVAVYANFKRIS